MKDWVERGGYLFTEDWGMADVLERAWPAYAKNGTYLAEQMVDVYPPRGSATHPLLRGVFVTKKKTIVQKKVSEKKGDMTTGVDVDEETLDERLTQPKNEWKVDDESPNIVIVNNKVVTILLESKKVSDMRGGNGAVAFTFGGPKYIPGTGTTRKKGKKGLTTGVPVDGRTIDKKGRSRAVPGPMGRVLHVLSHFGRQQTQEDCFALQNMLLNFLIEGREMMKHRKKAK